MVLTIPISCFSELIELVNQLRFHTKRQDRRGHVITPHDVVYDVDVVYSYLSIPLSVEYRNYLLIIYEHSLSSTQCE
nr:hypothetical protein [Pseudomonas sp. Lz4W]